jgi:hypothetical protein
VGTIAAERRYVIEVAWPRSSGLCDPYHLIEALGPIAIESTEILQATFFNKTTRVLELDLPVLLIEM